MSNENEITPEDLAAFVERCRERKEGELNPYNDAGIYIVHAIWSTLGENETSPDLTRKEALEILNDLPE